MGARYLSVMLFIAVIVLPAAATITYSPSSPNREQEVSFRLISTSIDLPEVQWEFGDGTIRHGGLTAAHTYILARVYTVKASYLSMSGGWVTETVNITVLERRKIDFNPRPGRRGAPVVFDALYFLSGSIAWNFGDGTIRTGGRKISHTYAAAGTFDVKATDLGGRSRFPVSIRINVIANPASITFSPPAPHVLEPVTCTAVNFLSKGLIRWDFGDGTVIEDISPPSIVHAYSSEGTFHVKAYEGNAPTPTAEKPLRVYGPPGISISPMDPRSGENVTCTAVNFISKSRIRWDFGDGILIDDTTPPAVTHIYRAPGAYQLKAYDEGDTAPSAEKVVNVLPKRSVTWQPSPSREKERITFHAVDFTAATLRWNFGDGTPDAHGPMEMSHTYGNPGTYIVTISDWRDGRWFPVTAPVRILPAQGARGKFNISYINLSFEEGSPYAVVTKGYQGLNAVAGMKFEGTGLFFAQWKVDGYVLRTESRMLNYAEDIQIDSGELGLPTFEAGLHEVTLEIIQPRMEYDIPTLRYFVIAGEPGATPVSFGFLKAEALSGEEMTLEGDVLDYPAGESFMIHGEMRNRTGDATSPHLLLRIYIGNRLIDNQLHSGLSGNQTRIFETSVSLDSQKTESLFFVLYDIALNSPVLLAFKEIRLRPVEVKTGKP